MKNLLLSALPSLVILGPAAPIHAQQNVDLPLIKTVAFDPKAGFLVNGRPFFPVILYDVPTDEGTLRELREFGFNVLMCDGKISESLPARGFYGAVHTGKKLDSLTGVFLAMGTDSPALHFKKDLLRHVGEANAKVRAMVPGRPVMNAIGYWEDEPAGVIAGKLPSRENYDDLVRSIDVSAPYLYPVPYQPAASVGEAMARARLACAGKKPLVPVLQLFTWEAKDRYPTPAELRCMAFLALVEGASGIGYYSYGSVTGRPKTTIAMAQPGLWQSVKKLNREIAETGRRFVGGKTADDFSLEKIDSTLKIRSVIDNEAVFAVVVNSASIRQDAKLVWKAANTQGFLTFAGGKKVAIINGTATLPLDPFGVEILRWLPSR